MLRVDRGEHRTGGFGGIAQLLAALLFARLADGVEDRVIVRDRTRRARLERPAQSVRNDPGATAVTAMPNGAISLPSVSEMPSSANL